MQGEGTAEVGLGGRSQWRVDVGEGGRCDGDIMETGENREFNVPLHLRSSVAMSTDQMMLLRLTEVTM